MLITHKCSEVFIGGRRCIASRWVLFSYYDRLDIFTHRDCRTIFAGVFQVDVNELYLLTWHTTTTNHLHCFFAARRAPHILEFNVAKLHFGWRLQPIY